MNNPNDYHTVNIKRYERLDQNNSPPQIKNKPIISLQVHMHKSGHYLLLKYYKISRRKIRELLYRCELKEEEEGI